MSERILAYLDRISCTSGDRVSLMISAPAGTYSARILRYRGGAVDGEPAPAETVAECGQFGAGPQPVATGSHADLPLAGLGAPPFALALCFLPTLPDLNRRQTLLDLDGLLQVHVDGCRLVFASGGAEAATAAVLEKHWFGLALQAGVSDAQLTLFDHHGRQCADLAVPSDSAGETSRELRLAAPLAGTSGGCFNGKISAPHVFRGLHRPDALISRSGPMPDLAWDFARWDRIDAIRGVAGASDGQTTNLPARGVTGRLWDGTAQKPADDPSHYDAIHFHDDDLSDARWTESLDVQLAQDLASGVYAVEISGEAGCELVPFFVRAASPDPDRVLLLIPTNTYVAYANERLVDFDLSDMMDHEARPSARERYVLDHPELGKSVYDLHTDGGGVFYSSRLRPVLNLHPDEPNWLNNGPRHLAADLHIIGFLEHFGIPYDVATDTDLHRNGEALLRGYGAVLTASHPEYATRNMVRALQSFAQSGGRLIYLGGNGFYWTCDLIGDEGDAIEIRRGFAGTRSWSSEPGEAYLSGSGDIGGLWRHAGCPPNRITGLGFTAEGWGKASAYRRLKASRGGPGARFFAGIEGDLIGADGLALGAAAGDELDRFDEKLGAPGIVFRLATSEPISERYRLVVEDQMVSAPDTRGSHHPDVRADMIYVQTEAGGRIFSVGSICFAAALPIDGFANPAARLLRNVVADFTS